MNLKIATLILTLLGTNAFASTLAGSYKVESSRACNLQQDTIERILLADREFTQDLFVREENRYAPIFSAQIGDEIQRPTPDLQKKGYHSVDRRITTYDQASDEIKFTEYIYDMSMSDDDGLKTVPYKTISFKATDKGINYMLHFSDDETYHCTLIRQ